MIIILLFFEMSYFGRSPYELRVWHLYTPEEKSYTIYKAYEGRALKSEDIQSFLFKDRVNTWTMWGFPVVSYAAIYKTGLLGNIFKYR